MKLYEALASTLVDAGVKVFFALIAGGIDELTRDLAEVKHVRYVRTRHEEIAVGMADGYSRATGEIGVAIIDGGPGFANAAAALLAARMSGSRILVLMSGTEGAGRHTYDLVNRHNNMSFDQAPLLDATVGAWLTIRSPATLAEDVARAFRHIRLGRGPIVLTFDGQRRDMPADWRNVPRVMSRWYPASHLPRPADIEALAGLIRASERPLILAGHGAWLSGAEGALASLAEHCGGLLATTGRGKGMFKGDPYSLGVSGSLAIEESHAVLKQADLVVAFGAQLNVYTLDHGRLYGAAHLAQIDIDPAAIGEFNPVELAVVADAKETAAALMQSLAKIERPQWRGPDMAARIAKFDRWRDRDMTERPGLANIRRVVDALDRLATPRRMLCVDIGLFMGPPVAYMTVPSPAAQILPWQLGRMGAALPVAAGAAIGRPDLLMICFVGDGGMMAATNALDSLRAERIPMLLVVMDDGGFGADRHILEMHQESTAICDYETPDLVAIAKVYGLNAFRVTSGAEMETVLKDNDLTGATTLIHVLIDPSTPAQEMDFAIYKSAAPR